MATDFNRDVTPLYSWNQTGPVATAMTSSIENFERVLKVSKTS